VWRAPEAPLGDRAAPTAKSRRRANTLIAWCLVVAELGFGWTTPLAQVVLLLVGLWLTWRHFADARAAKKRPPIPWPGQRAMT
jgi:hypothetical protein